MSLLWLLLSSSFAGSGQIAWSVGPTAMFVLPGLAARVDRIVADRLSLNAEIHGETVGTAGRVGLRIGTDWRLGAAEGLRGWFAGPRAGVWHLSERAGPTTAVQLRAIGGHRLVTAKQALLSAGGGVTWRSVLVGDSSLGRRLLPTVEIRIGGVR